MKEKCKTNIHKLKFNINSGRHLLHNKVQKYLNRRKNWSPESLHTTAVQIFQKMTLNSISILLSVCLLILQGNQQGLFDDASGFYDRYYTAARLNISWKKIFFTLLTILILLELLVLHIYLWLFDQSKLPPWNHS